VAKAAFTLKEVGDIYPELVKTEAGYHIIKLTGKRKELARTLDQARRPIQHRLWRERREAAVEAFVKSLRDKAKVEENWAALDQIQIEAAPVAPVPGTPALKQDSAKSAKETSK
jgi:peptidyl-prolyl cis-trans isomerase C